MSFRGIRKDAEPLPETLTETFIERDKSSTVCPAVDINFDLPTIGEMTRIFSSIKNNRPTSGTRREKASTFPYRRHDTSTNCNRFSSAKPESERRHFSCILSKHISQSSAQRIACSATYGSSRSTHRISAYSAKRSLTAFGTQRTRNPVCQKTDSCSLGVIFQPSEIEKQIVKHSTCQNILDCSVNQLEDSLENTVTPTIEESEKPVIVEEVVDLASNETAVDSLENENGVSSPDLKLISTKPESVEKSPSIEMPVQSLSKQGVLMLPAKEDVICTLKGKTSLSMDKNEEIQTKHFSVQTFIEEGTSHAWINIIIRNPHEQIEVRRVKTGAGQALGLQPESLKIFGLFRGSFGDPVELLLDENTVPENDSNFYLQRVCFNPQVERVVTNSDLRAKELLFWEAHYMFSSDKIYPKPEDDVVKLMESLLENESSFVSRPSLANQGRFMDMIRDQSQYYWSYYYRREKCVLEDIISDDHCIETGIEVTVVMSEKHLTFINGSNEEEIVSWSWNKIRCVKMQDFPKRLFMFEVLNIVDEKEVLNLVSVATDSNKYLYSVGSHIFKVHEARQKEQIPSTNQLAEFSNRVFKRFDNLAERKEAKTRMVLVEEESEEDENIEMMIDEESKKMTLNRKPKGKEGRNKFN